MIRSKKIKDAARDEPCTLEVGGVCKQRADTTVACHFPPRGETGLSMKGSDLFVAFGCADCHDAMDGRSSAMKRFGEDWLFYAHRGIYRTQQRLIDKGILVIK